MIKYDYTMTVEASDEIKPDDVERLIDQRVNTGEGVFMCLQEVMNKQEVLKELKDIQDFDSQRNHAECVLLNHIGDKEISEAFMDAEDKTQTGYRTRTVRCGDDDPEEIQVMQMISQIMYDDINDPSKSIPAIIAWFNAKYQGQTVTLQWSGNEINPATFTADSE